MHCKIWFHRKVFFCWKKRAQFKFKQIRKMFAKSFDFRHGNFQLKFREKKPKNEINRFHIHGRSDAYETNIIDQCLRQGNYNV